MTFDEWWGNGPDMPNHDPSLRATLRQVAESAWYASQGAIRDDMRDLSSLERAATHLAESIIHGIQSGDFMRTGVGPVMLIAGMFAQFAARAQLVERERVNQHREELKRWLNCEPDPVVETNLE